MTAHWQFSLVWHSLLFGEKFLSTSFFFVVVFASLLLSALSFVLCTIFTAIRKLLSISYGRSQRSRDLEHFWELTSYQLLNLIWSVSQIRFYFTCELNIPNSADDLICLERSFGKWRWANHELTNIFVVSRKQTKRLQGLSHCREMIWKDSKKWNISMNQRLLCPLPPEQKIVNEASDRSIQVIEWWNGVQCSLKFVIELFLSTVCSCAAALTPTSRYFESILLRKKKPMKNFSRSSLMIFRSA